MTISARPPWRAFIRRALARISITVTRGLSSRYSGIVEAVDRLADLGPVAVDAAGRCAASASRPRPRCDRMRWVSSAWPISSENTSTGLSRRLGDVRGDAETEAVLPIAGRAPTMLSVRRLQARQELVEVVVAGGRAGDGVAALEGLLQLVHRQRQQVAERLGGVDDAVLGDLEDLRLGLVERLGDVVGFEVARSRRSRWRRRSAGAAPPCPGRSWRSAPRWRSPASRSAARAAAARRRSRRAGRRGAARRQR